MSKATSQVHDGGQARRQRVEQGVYQRTGADGRTTYEIGFRDSQGKQRWRRVEGGVKAARAALAAAHSERARGVRVAADPRLRFGDAADAWWEARAVKLRPATQSAYGAGLKHLLEHFARTRMVDITPADVAAYVSRQQAAGLKGWTIKGHLTVLQGVYRYAVRHLGLIATNPVSLLDRVERPSSDDERPKRILTPDELHRLLDAVDEPHRIIFETGAETGARLGEVLGLVWGEVELESETITFTHQLDRQGRRVALKTKRSRRVVEVTPGLVSKLRAVKLAAPASGPHDFVFVTRAGTPHDHRNIAGRVLGRAVERAGLEPVERDGQVVEYAPTFHSLRHSHGSALIAAGWDIEEVSARLGHSNVGTTQRIYVHAYDAARRSGERRSRLTRLYGTADSDVEASMEAPDGSNAQNRQQAATTNVRDMQGKRRRAQ